MKRKVYSFNSELYKVTGVQKVVLDVHLAVRGEYEAKIVGTIPFGSIHTDLQINKDEYVRFCSPFQFRNSIVILHERKFLMLFWILNHLLFQNIRMVYVHHSMLYGHKFMTKLPKHIVAISEAGINNLTEYFGAPKEHITKIYNCVKDIHPHPHPYHGTLPITLLLPARVNEIKQQIELVKQLRGKLSSKVRILFAGIGPEYEQLKELTKGDEQFVTLGHRSDVYDLLRECDYMLLFSKHEGLPITLIEADMTGTPIICNNVGGNIEIVRDGENGFIVNDWHALIELLNSLEDITNDEYLQMSRRGRQIYEQKFTFEQFKYNYLKLLEEL